ncbi:MAG: twin transmembrane helix small protein [Rickettsiaceae bacterium]|nr:MAG: twin transmembrane helix small protein [Rickettsiaceae bacterium]
MIYIIGAIALTTLVLITGLFVMIRGSKSQEKLSSKLMSLRVIFQAIAIILLAGMYFFNSPQ